MNICWSAAYLITDNDLKQPEATRNNQLLPKTTKTQLDLKWNYEISALFSP